MASSEPSKQSLRTSKDVYDRIKWDLSENSDIKSFYIGYEDRFEGMQEMPFLEFEPGGDIPWHRIYYFRKDDDILWDRRKRIDTIFGSGGEKSTSSTTSKKSKHRTRKRYDDDDRDSDEFPIDVDEKIMDPEIVTATDLSNLSLPKGFKILADHCFAFDNVEQVWKPLKEQKSFCPKIYDGQSLKIISYNVLFGLYGFDVETREDERIPALLDCLRSSDADFVCLQEVTEKLMKIILTECWIRENFYLSQDATTSDPVLLKPCGQLTMSKFPISQTAYYPFGPQKRFLAVDIRLSEVVSLRIVNIHFTSTKREEDNAKTELGVKRRLQQLSTTLNAANENCVTFCCGDFNFGDDTVEYAEMKKLMHQYKFCDAWDEINPTNPGYTFDPPGNSLAKFTASKHFEPRRLDRILVRNSNKCSINLEEMILLGVNPIGTHLQFSQPPLFISDHYGLVLKFSVTEVVQSSESFSPVVEKPVDTVMDFQPEQIDLSNIKPAYSSSVCLVPSKLGPFYSVVQHIRAQYDPHCHRWPPHINLLYPFIPDEANNFKCALTTFESLFKEWDHFGKRLVVVFRRFGIFERKTSSTVFLYPEIFSDESWPLDSADQQVYLFQDNSKIRVDANIFRLSCIEEDNFDEHPLNVLYQKMKQRFPLCGDDRRSQLFPHLSVATFNNVYDARLAAASWQKVWKPVQCTFTSVAMMSRGRDTPFVGKNVIPFCEVPFEIPTTFSTYTVAELREQGRQGLFDILKKAGVTTVATFWFGSVATKMDSKNSDADLCICTTKSVEEIIRILCATPQFPEISGSNNRFSSGFQFPTFHLWHCVNYADDTSFKLLRYEEAISKCVEMEVSFAAVPENWFTSENELNLNQPIESLDALDWTSLKSISGVRDGEFLKEFLMKHNHSFLQQFFKLIKKWSALRCIDNHSAGFVPKIAWLVMAINVYEIYGSHFGQLSENEALKQLVFHFFHHFSNKTNWNPLQGNAISVSNDSKKAMQNFYESKNTITKGSQHMCVMGVTYPFSNYCRNITSSTMAVVRDEIKKALDVYQKNENAFDILKPLKSVFFQLYPFYVSFSLTVVGVAPSEESVSKWPLNFPPDLHNMRFRSPSLKIAYKWLQSQIVTVVLQLEKCLKNPKPKQIVVVHPYSQPFSLGHGTVTMFIGYNANLDEIKTGQLEKLFEYYKTNFEQWKCNPSANCSCVELDVDLLDSTSNVVVNQLKRIENFDNHVLLV